MDYGHDKKDLVVRTLPDPPILRGESVELPGFQRVIHDSQIGRIERAGLKERRKILVDTKTQLFRDKMAAIIAAYRYQMALAREAFIKEGEEYINYIIDQSRIRIANDKQQAIKKAVENFADLLLGIRPDLQPALVDMITQSGQRLLDRTIDEILTSSYDLKKASAEYYPNRRF